MVRLLKPLTTRRWYHWLIAGLAKIGILTFAQIGLLAVLGTPISPHRSWPGALCTAVALQLFLWYLTWLDLHPKA